jgi:hypothetical protein
VTMGSSSTSRHAWTVVGRGGHRRGGRGRGGDLALRADTNKKQRCEGEEEKQVDLASSTTSRRG